MQIDNTYRNYFLRTKVTLTLDQHLIYPSGSSCGEKVFNVTCNTTPLIVVSGSGSTAAGTDLLITPPAGGHGTAGTYSVSMLGPYNSTIEVYVFDALGSSDMSGVTTGLKVWGPSGEPIFNSGAKPLRIVGALTAAPSSLPTGIAIPSGKKYGVLCNGGYYTTTTGGSPITYLYFGYVASITSTGYATIGIVQTGSTTTSGTVLSQSTTAFVVDLTNYG